jgi:flavodoxin-like protein
MRAVVVYESMYGNTHQIAEAIAEGLKEAAIEVSIVPLAEATRALDLPSDLLVIGGPTHVHGMSGVHSRQAAVNDADAKHLTLDDSAPGPGLREWLSTVETTALPPWYAAFDTRIDGAPLLTGRAAPKIAKVAHRLGLEKIAEPESFLVSRTSWLLPGEPERARQWGATLVTALAASVTASRRGAR